jgi:hypothetical protein
METRVKMKALIGIRLHFMPSKPPRFALSVTEPVRSFNSLTQRHITFHEPLPSSSLKTHHVRIRRRQTPTHHTLHHKYKNTQPPPTSTSPTKPTKPTNNTIILPNHGTSMVHRRRPRPPPCPRASHGLGWPFQEPDGSSHQSRRWPLDSGSRHVSLPIPYPNTSSSKVLPLTTP